MDLQTYLCKVILFFWITFHFQEFQSVAIGKKLNMGQTCIIFTFRIIYISYMLSFMQ